MLFLKIFLLLFFLFFFSLLLLAFCLLISLRKVFLFDFFDLVDMSEEEVL